ncbi:TPA: FtsX-like permease family protein [Streptococcus equi subsp. zooepidemicus]|nr:FtsX-like permease family protein [Streptococcus equi subsp. zooepidemicus]
MFSKLVARNSKRDRKNNGLYFGSMIISIIAFYIILSLSHQDVMIFLQKMESDAVSRLFTIIPIFYISTLVILFFLIYFASSMQIERRKHEFGVYLTLGMRRQNLFSMLMLEDFRNNIIALGIGLPIAIMISELISLITAKIVGLGIIGHRFSLSFMAILFTIVGFMIVKFVAFVLLSARIANKEIGELLTYSPFGVKRMLPKGIYLIGSVVGTMFLVKAYHYGISGEAWDSTRNMGITVLIGTLGTILLFFGVRLFIGALVNLGSKRKLHAYNFRQIQELVIQRSTVLAICSLLIFSALCLFGAGVAISRNSSNNQTHIFDYTFKDNDLAEDENIDVNKVVKKIKEAGLESQFEKIIEIKIGNPKADGEISFAHIVNILKDLKDSKNKEILIHNLEQYGDCKLISLSGYNELRKAAKLKPIELKDNEAALYMGEEFLIDSDLMNAVVQANPQIEVMGKTFKITGDVQSLPIVTDREITIAVAMVVSDDVFAEYTDGTHSNYVSGILAPNIVEEKGLMQAISATNEKLDKASIEYESYIQNMGRQLFFVISASYITIYLATILLVVANTIIGVQFLMGQRKSHRRYQTLIHLGATYETLCKSSGKQINWYFGLPIVIALINSFFGVRSLFTGILPSSVKANISQVFIIAIFMILLLGIFEVIYMGVVKRNSNKYLLSLMEPKREE